MRNDEGGEGMEQRTDARRCAASATEVLLPEEFPVLELVAAETEVKAGSADDEEEGVG
jgi:hypothetical protein